MKSKKSGLKGFERNLRNWRWWAAVPVMLALLPLPLFNELARVVMCISESLSERLVHPLYIWVHRERGQNERSRKHPV